MYRSEGPLQTQNGLRRCNSPIDNEAEPTPAAHQQNAILDPGGPGIGVSSFVDPRRRLCGSVIDAESERVDLEPRSIVHILKVTGTFKSQDLAMVIEWSLSRESYQQDGMASVSSYWLRKSFRRLIRRRTIWMQATAKGVRRLIGIAGICHRVHVCSVDTSCGTIARRGGAPLAVTVALVELAALPASLHIGTGATGQLSEREDTVTTGIRSSLCR